MAAVTKVVGSRCWPLISRYRASVRTQSPKVEMIDSCCKPLDDGKDDGIIRELLHNQSAKKANADNFQFVRVEYTEDKLQKYIQEDDDTLPLKLGDGTVSCDTRFMLGTDKRATITTNWSWFRHHANIQEGNTCAFHFKRKEGRRLSLTVHRL